MIANNNNSMEIPDERHYNMDIIKITKSPNKITISNNIKPIVKCSNTMKNQTSPNEKKLPIKPQQNIEGIFKKNSEDFGNSTYTKQFSQNSLHSLSNKSQKEQFKMFLCGNQSEIHDKFTYDDD